VDSRVEVRGFFLNHIEGVVVLRTHWRGHTFPS
jgi:hypothetical protein